MWKLGPRKLCGISAAVFVNFTEGATQELSAVGAVYSFVRGEYIVGSAHILKKKSLERLTQLAHSQMLKQLSLKPPESPKPADCLFWLRLRSLSRVLHHTVLPTGPDWCPLLCSFQGLGRAHGANGCCCRAGRLGRSPTRSRRHTFCSGLF